MSCLVTVLGARLDDFASLGIPWLRKAEITVCLAQPQEKRWRVPRLAQSSLEYSQ